MFRLLCSAVLVILAFRAEAAPDPAEAKADPAPAAAPRGMWHAEVLVDPTGDPVGRVQFAVQDFVPQRLKVSAKTAATLLRPGDTVEIAIDGRFLYGAAAGGMLGVRPVLTATLSADHRASDGHRGSLFLTALSRLLQQPEKL